MCCGGINAVPDGDVELDDMMADYGELQHFELTSIDYDSACLYAIVHELCCVYRALFATSGTEMRRSMRNASAAPFSEIRYVQACRALFPGLGCHGPLDMLSG